MNPIEEKEHAENQEEPKGTEKSQEKENSKEPSIKDGQIEGDVLNLGEGDNDSSSEAKKKEKDGEENKEEAKEDEKKEEGVKEGEGEEGGGEGEGGENKDAQNSEQQKETFKSISGEDENENEVKRGEEVKMSQNLGSSSKINEEKTREKTFENVKLIYNYQKNQIGKMDNLDRKSVV